MTYDVFKDKVRTIIGDEPSEDMMNALSAMETDWVDDAYEARIKAEAAIRERDEIKQKYYDRFWEGETVTDEHVAGTSEGTRIANDPTTEIERIANDLFLI